MTTPVPVTLCIVNHDGAEHLYECFAALRQQDWVFDETVLVDNASQDSSLAVTRRHCPEARVIRLPENRGPGAARNAGFREAANDLILFLDNDVRLRPDTVRLLVEYLQQRPRCLLVAPRVLYAGDPQTVQYDSADCHYLGLMLTRNADRKVDELDKESCETTSMVSAAFLIDRSKWRGGPPFDESFGFNLEDHDFGVRARITGHLLAVEPRAEVHHGAGTSGLSYRPGALPAERRLYYLTLNRWLVITRCYAGRTLLLLSPALLLFETMQLLWLLGGGHLATWRQAFRAYRNAWRRVRNERRKVQHDRRVLDGEVLRDGRLPLTAAVRERWFARVLVGAADFVLGRYWRLVRRWV